MAKTFYTTAVEDLTVNVYETDASGELIYREAYPIPKEVRDYAIKRLIENPSFVREVYHYNEWGTFFLIVSDKYDKTYDIKDFGRKTKKGLTEWIKTQARKWFAFPQATL